MTRNFFIYHALITAALIPLGGCDLFSQSPEGGADSDGTHAAVTTKSSVQMREEMEREIATEYGTLEKGLGKFAANPAGTIGWLKGNTSCREGEVQIFLDEMDYGIGATTTAQKAVALEQQHATSRIRYGWRPNTTGAWECGGSETDIANANYPAWNCLVGHGMEGVQRYPGFPGHNAGLDTKFRLCKSVSSYLSPAKHAYAVVALNRDNSKTGCGCPFPSHMFSVDFPTDVYSASAVVGDAGPTLISSNPDYVRIFFCYREGQGYFSWNQWEWTSNYGNVGAFTAIPDHGSPFRVDRDQEGASNYQGAWEIHPPPRSANAQNYDFQVNYQDCVNEGYWTQTKKDDVSTQLFMFLATNGRIWDTSIHWTWAGY